MRLPPFGCLLGEVVHGRMAGWIGKIESINELQYPFLCSSFRAPFLRE